VWGHYFTKQAGFQDVLKLLQKREVMLDRSFPFSHGGLSENGPAARVTRDRKIEALIKSDSSQQIGDYKKLRR